MHPPLNNSHFECLRPCLQQPHWSVPGMSGVPLVSIHHGTTSLAMIGGSVSNRAVNDALRSMDQSGCSD